MFTGCTPLRAHRDSPYPIQKFKHIELRDELSVHVFVAAVTDLCSLAPAAAAAVRTDSGL